MDVLGRASACTWGHQLSCNESEIGVIYWGASSNTFHRATTCRYHIYIIQHCFRTHQSWRNRSPARSMPERYICVSVSALCLPLTCPLRPSENHFLHTTLDHHTHIPLDSTMFPTCLCSSHLARRTCNENVSAAGATLLYCTRTLQKPCDQLKRATLIARHKTSLPRRLPTLYCTW